MKNYADRGGCYPSRPDNILSDLHEIVLVYTKTVDSLFRIL